MSQELEAGSASRKEIELRLPKIAVEAGVWPNPNDKLERRTEIENLTPVLLNAQAPLVLALEAPWGGGKSTFIKLWQQFLAYSGSVSLTLNAWEADFCEDPLLPLLSILDDWLSEQREEGEARKAWKKAKKLAPGLIKTSAVASVKAGTLGALDLEKAVESAIANAAGEVTGNVVESFKRKVNTLNRFKNLLASALAALPEGQSNLIIFVDELDRCRPSYAIELLERIKHLFDIERIVFVLAINREQLGKSLQGIYGPAFDGEYYLKRFIDLDYQLRVQDLRSYIYAQLSQPDIQRRADVHRSNREECDWIRESFVWLCGRFDYQLRDVNQLIIRFRLILHSVDKNRPLYPEVLSVMLILREQNPALYRSFCTDPLRINEVVRFLLGKALDDGAFMKEFSVVSGMMIGTLIGEEQKSDILKYWCEIRDKYDQGSEQYRAVEQMRRIATKEGSYGNGKLVRLIHDRIELFEQINISD